jgi:hypothetical protein
MNQFNLIKNNYGFFQDGFLVDDRQPVADHDLAGTILGQNL